MYHNFFGLRFPPFDDRIDTRFLFLSADHEEALATMEYAVRQRRGTALILGEPGTGKTTLVRALLSRVARDEQVVVLKWPPGGAMSLVRETCKGFGVTLPVRYTRARGLARLRRHMARSIDAGRRAALIVDQAEHLTEENLEQLAAMMDLEHDNDGVMGVMLVGAASLEATLDKGQFARLRQQFFDRRMLTPLGIEDTKRYIAHRLSVAGCTDAEQFDEEAVELIHRASCGIPRMINRMCDAALLAAYGSGRRRVTVQSARDVIGVAEPASASRAGSEQTASDLPLMRETRPMEPAPEALPPMQETFLALDRDNMPLEHPQVSAQGEALLQRLERAIARAERMAATSEAGTSRAEAVEKHLAQLTDEAGRATAGLADGIRRAAASVTKIEHQAQGCVRDAQARVAQIARESGQLQSLAQRADAGTQSLEKACGRAEHVATDLKSSAENLADKADAVQERMTVLMTGLKASDEAERRLRDAIDCAAASVQAAQDVARKHDAIAKETADVIDTFSNRSRLTLEQLRREHEAQAREMGERLATSLHEQMGQLRRNGDNAVETARREIASMKTQTDAAVSEAAARSDRLADELRAKLDAIIKESRTMVEQVERVVSEGREAIRRLVKDADAARTTAAEGMQCDMTALGEQIHALEARRDDAQRSIQAVKSATTDLAGTVTGLEQRVDALASRGRELGAHAEAAVKNVHEAAQRGEKLLADVQESCGKVDAAQRGIAASLLDVGAGAERAAMAREQATQCEQLMGRLSTEREQAARLLDQLAAHANDGTELREGIRAATVEAEARVTQLDSHYAAATRILRELSDANVSGHRAAEEANESVRLIQEAQAQTSSRIEKLSESLTELTRRAEEGVGRLAEQEHNVGALLDRVESILQPAASRARQLADLTRVSEDRMTALTDWCKQASDTIERATAVDTMLREAQDVQTNLTATVQHARALHDALTASTADTDHRRTMLADLNTRADAILGRHQEARQEGQRVIEELAAHVQATRASVDAGDRLLAEFSGRAESIGRQISELHTQAQKIERGIEAAAGAPAQTLAAGQALAARIERLCEAVRKIFAGVSKATLDARRNTSEFTRASADASERFTHLRSETAQACDVLREWVEEAVRVQARLARTLRRAPSLRETHSLESFASVPRKSTDTARRPGAASADRPVELPTAALTAMAGAQRESESVGNSPTMERLNRGGRVHALSSRGESAEGMGEATRPTSRAEQIARLIEEARVAASAR